MNCWIAIPQVTKAPHRQCEPALLRHVDILDSARQPDGGTATVRATEDGQVYNPLFRFISRFVVRQTRTIDAYRHRLGKATGQEVEVGD
ncbi:MAG: hypothetical protein WAM91_05830 [Candidatus Acidiferrales bacterium]